MGFAKANRGGLRESAGLPPALRLLTEQLPILGVGTIGEEPVFGWRGFAADPIAAVAAARAAETAVTAALAHRQRGLTEAAPRQTRFQVEFTLDEAHEPGPIVLFDGGEDAVRWPYELTMVGEPLPHLARPAAARQLRRALTGRAFRKRIGQILRSDGNITALQLAGATLRFRYGWSWHPCQTWPQARLRFGIWLETGQPVALASQSAAAIVTVLIAALPLQRKTAMVFTDAVRRIAAN